MPESRPLNYTTTVAVEQTVGECHKILAGAGASAVSVEYDDGHPSGLWFRLDTPHGRRNFALPVDVEAMRRVLVKAEEDGLFDRTAKGARSHTGRGTYSSYGHAERVAWRVVKDWLEANLALIRAQMARLDEVMLPYLMVDDERTLYRAYRDSEKALELEAGSA